MKKFFCALFEIIIALNCVFYVRQKDDSGHILNRNSCKAYLIDEYQASEVMTMTLSKYVELEVKLYDNNIPPTKWETSTSEGEVIYSGVLTMKHFKSQNGCTTVIYEGMSYAE